MENKNNKCFSIEHKEIIANSYCFECKIYMCNKCENLHSKLFKNHQSHKLDKDLNEIFTGFCKYRNHKDELEFFCKNHNELCCTACISKIKKEGKGQHTDCDVCLIEDIINEKKQKLNENMGKLENLSNNINEIINQLKTIYEKINKDKEEIKLKIQNIFTKIRNALNDREDSLITEVDKIYDNTYFNENIIKDSEKLPDKIISSLENWKKINGKWNEENKLNLLINECINIENNINQINSINVNIAKFKILSELKIKFSPEEENEIQKFLQNIKTFGKIENDINEKITESINYLVINNIIIDSNIIKNKFELAQINNGVKHQLNKNIKKINLLYRCSRDGDSISSFHKNCDNHSNVLFLVETKENRKFGGFTSLHYSQSGGYSKDDNAFIFSLTNKENYYIIKGKNALCLDNRGIIFGQTSNTGSEFHISNREPCLTADNSFDDTGSNNCYDYGGRKHALAGKKQFTVLDYEVFELQL